MSNSQFPNARKSGLVIQEVPDEVLVFDLESNKAHCLNPTAATVWKSCDGKTSIQEIASILEKQSGKGVSDDVVWLAIDQLNENSLLDGKVISKFAGQSRRDVIKKIGLASMIAIPVVASLVAPTSALAATSCFCDLSNGNNDCVLQPTCPQTCDPGNSGLCI